MVDFYYLPGSSPCRSVIMTAKAVGVDLNKKLLNLQAGEHLKPEFIKINPQHTIPTLVDNGFALWESRAIQVYLVEKYGKTDSLYPKCPKKRAVINQRLYFDMGTSTRASPTTTTRRCSPRPPPIPRPSRRSRPPSSSSTPSWRVRSMPPAIPSPSPTSPWWRPCPPSRWPDSILASTLMSTSGTRTPRR